MTDPRLALPPAPKGLRLILVRHGQTLANREHFLQGATDDPMTEEGRKQADQLGHYLKDAHIDRVLSSDLHRAIETAESIARYHNLIVEVNPLAREWNCGTWDGKPASEFLRLLNESGLPVSSFRPPGGEILAEVRERACSLIAKIRESSQGKAVLLCSHGDFMRTTLSCLLDIDVDRANVFRFENGSYTILEFTGIEWQLIGMSCLPPG